MLLPKLSLYGVGSAELATVGRKVKKVIPGHKGHKGYPARKESKDRGGLSDHKALRVFRVFRGPKARRCL